MGWRGWIALGWVLLILVLLGGFAWLTQNPDAEILDEARDWPLIGPLAERFRQAYLPNQAPSRAASETGEPATEVVRILLLPEGSLAKTFVWVQPGTPVHEEPDRSSPVVHTMGSIGNLPVLERRGDWYRVSRPLGGFEHQQGWVWLENYQEPSKEVLNQPDPVLPVPANAIDPEVLAVARSLMPSGSVRVDCGAYPLITDAQDAEWLRLCAAVTNQVENIYCQRYGLEPVSPPAETILFFRLESSYEEFGVSQGVPWEFDTAHASASRGYLALCQGDRSTTSLLGSLVHELAHLINRRSLGPWLPPWLEEGIADDLGESEITEEGSIVPGVLGGETTLGELRVTRRGGRAAAIELQNLARSDQLPSLRSLMELDREQFYAARDRKRNYALGSFWIRYLLSEQAGDLSSGFRSFLRGIADGQPITSERFLADLDADWESLESGFRTWLHVQFLMPPNETRSESN